MRSACASRIRASPVASCLDPHWAKTLSPVLSNLDYHVTTIKIALQGPHEKSPRQSMLVDHPKEPPLKSYSSAQFTLTTQSQRQECPARTRAEPPKPRRVVQITCLIPASALCGTQLFHLDTEARASRSSRAQERPRPFPHIGTPNKKCLSLAAKFQLTGGPGRSCSQAPNTSDGP
jgi:hypothetical protein